MSSLNAATPAHRPPRSRRRVAVVGVAIAALLVVAVGMLIVTVRGRDAGTSHAGAPAVVTARPAQAELTLATGARPIVVPAGFLGISTEYWTIPVWARQLPELTRVLSLLSVDAPLRLRIGGDSADHAFWSPTRELPEWVFELTPSWLTQISEIVRRSHARLILDLNLVTSTPQQAARWARTAEAKLPKGSISALEIGNEPDIYNQSSWQHITASGGSRGLPARITAAWYARAYATYARALASVAPGVPLLAPALAEPQKNLSWIATLLKAPHPGLMGVTAHRYPYSACSHRPTSPTFPTVARVLSENATADMAQTALSVERISDRAGLPLWLTEINSVTCGGTRGVSNTFATALWAPDALLELVQAGVESASVHVRHNAINMAFSLTARGLIAHPLLYGMVLFARTLGPGAQLLPAHLAGASGVNLKAWVVQVRGNVLHVLLIDKGRRPVSARLNLPVTGTGTVQRLLAPSVRSTSHVTLDGQQLSAGARWQGAPTAETINPGPRGYVVRLPGYSAALVTLTLR